MSEELDPKMVWNEDEPLRGFAQSEMVKCEKCQRANPPTRANCLYCGTALPQMPAGATLFKPTLRPLEKWEQGFNPILLSSAQGLSDAILKDAAELLKFKVEDIKRFANSETPLPLARAATLEEATLIQQRLGELGLEILIIADAELDSLAPKRLRTVEFTDKALIVYPVGSQSEQPVSWQEINLLVAGRHFMRRLEVAERPGKKSEKEIVDSRELSADELRLDIYDDKGEGAWRIAADNFDFSCLGETKSLIASQNFQTLVGKLRQCASHAVYDDSYLRVRDALNQVWPLEQQTTSLGWRKQRMGRVNTEAVTTSDNETQFTRYSRLRHLLKLRNSESDT